VAQAFVGSNPTPRTIENVLSWSELRCAGCLISLEGLNPLYAAGALSFFPANHHVGRGRLLTVSRHDRLKRASFGLQQQWPSDVHASRRHGDRSLEASDQSVLCAAPPRSESNERACCHHEFAAILPRSNRDKIITTASSGVIMDRLEKIKSEPPVRV